MQVIKQSIRTIKLNNREFIVIIYLHAGAACIGSGVS
jgi:hypothetical protein